MKLSKKDIRWQQRFYNFQKALTSLEEFVGKDLSKLEKQGLVKAFEYTYDLGWNTLKDYLEHQGETGLSGSRDTIKKSFQAGLLTDGQVWMDMLESRNRTSHVYNEETANEISFKIQNQYHSAFGELRNKLLSLTKD